MSASWKDHWFQFAITIILVLIGTGFQVTGPKSIGIVLLIVGFGWLWWLILPMLAEKWNASSPRPLAALLGGWLVILLLEGIHFWWITRPDPTLAQQSSPLINQGGTITGGSGNTITNTINNFITVTPTANPRVTFGEPTLLNEKTQEGYQTHIPLKVITPYPIGNLSLVVHVKTLIRLDLSSPYVNMLSHGKVENGQAFIGAQNVHGDMTLVIDTSDPINPTNPVHIEHNP